MVEMKIKDVHRGFIEVDPLRVSTLICDIDGTVADNSHRTPWLMTKPKNWLAYNKAMDQDKPIQEIIDHVVTLHDHGWDIVFCSGREEVYRDVTEKWLDVHIGVNHPLFMRPKGDYRKDSIVKRELLNKIYYHGYTPTLVFDDRNQVVDMWREMGLECVQVNYGDF